MFIKIKGEKNEVFNLSRYQILAALKQELENMFGLSSIRITDSLQVKYSSNSHLIVRVARDDHQLLLAAIPFMTNLGKSKSRFDILRVSGTIKKLEEFIIEYDRKQLVLLNRHKQLEETRDMDDE